MSCAKPGQNYNNSPESQTNLQNTTDNTTIISTLAIPNTNVFMTNANGWNAQISNQELIFTNQTSTIKASKIELKAIASLNQISLEKYLEEKSPGRDFKAFEINGLHGVRTNYIDSDKKDKQFEIYLISEQLDQIFISGSVDVNTDADKVISSLRLKYPADIVKDSEQETTTLDTDNSSISFSKDCAKLLFGCKDISGQMNFDLKKSVFSLHAQAGAIKFLGNDQNGLYDSVKSNGEYIMAANEKYLASAVNTGAFKQKSPLEAKISKGHVYLVRSINLPHEDLIAKLRIDSISEKSITVTFRILLKTNQKNLKQTYVKTQTNLIASTKPISTGEAVLLKDDLFHLRYSQQFGQSINYFNWSIKVVDSNIVLDQQFIHINGMISSISKKNLKDVTKADFPNVPEFIGDKYQSVNIEEGKIYGLFQQHGNAELSSAYAAFQIVDKDENNQWIRIKFQFIHVDEFWDLQPEQDYSKYTFDELLTHNDIRFFVAESNSSKRSISYNAFADQLYIEDNPLTGQRGFFNFGKEANFLTLKETDIKSKIGKFTDKVDVSKGDVIGVYYENLSAKAMLLIYVDAHLRGEHVALRTKYFLVTDKETGGQK